MRLRLLNLARALPAPDPLAKAAVPCADCDGGPCAHARAERVHLSHPAHGPARHPATLCPDCGSLRPHGPARGLLRGLFAQDPEHPLAAAHRLKQASQTAKDALHKALDSHCYSSPESCGLRWITCHPGGDEGKGVPLLVHDNGEQYTVVGGAGGRLDHTVFQKPKGQDGGAGERKAKLKELRVKRQQERRAALGDEGQALEDKKKEVAAEAKRQTADLHTRVLSALHGEMKGDVLENIEREARARAAQEHTGASDAERQQFADRAAKAATQEARAAARQAVAKALDRAALRQMGEDDGSPAEVLARVGGKTLLRTLTPEQLDDFVKSSASIAALKGKARAIARALASGDQEAVQGVRADVAPIPQAEAERQNLSRYLTEQSVNANTALVRGSEAASAVTQRRNQANGAADALNSYAASLTGKAVLRPGAVKALGVENAARVAAAVLAREGKAGGETAEGLRQRVAQGGYAAVKAALDKVGEMDKLVDTFKDAAKAGDGSVTTAQASLQAANFAQSKMRILNVARGQLRAAAALAHHLEHPSARALSLPAGDTAVAAHAAAKGLGLKDGDYQVEKAARGEGGGYKLTVQAQDLHKLASPHTLAESDRNTAMDELRQSVEQDPGEWRPPGLRDNIRPDPHQELGARAIVQQKRMVLNHGAGSGKTLTFFLAASDLISSGKCDRGIITMPAKPRSNQVDRVEDGKPKTGEINKFLTPEMAGKIAVVNDGADLTRKLKEVKDGSKQVLILSPHLMREKVAELRAAGFGGDKSFFFGDEAHELAVGATEGAGSGMARAAKEMAKSEYCAVGSGSLIDNDSSELHSLLDLAHPGQYGDQKEFSEEWRRLAQSGGGLFRGEAMRGMRDRLSGGMVTYHEPVKGPDGRALTLERRTVTVRTSAQQKAAIAKINEQYKKDKAHADPAVSKAAALRREAAVRRVLNLGTKNEQGGYDNPKHEAIKRIMAEEKARDPKNRVGVYAFERRPLAEAGRAAGGKFVSITGDNDDKQTAAAVNAVNDRTNDTDGAMISSAGNYGLNMTGLDHMIKVGPMETPAKEVQLDHRHWRKGQTRNVRATTILTDHPSEQVAHYRTQHVKAPDLHLLESLADDTGTAHTLARHGVGTEATHGNGD